jgi:anhydro-N-acetylmuramic acid kinase
MPEVRPGERVGAPPLAHDDPRLVIGLVSGSSLDGVDAGLVSITGSCETAKIELLHSICNEYDDETRARLLELFEYKDATVDKLCMMHAILGELFAEAALRVADEHGTPMDDVYAVGIWGNMMYHLPARTAPFEWRGRKLGSSLQIGDLNRVALRTGVPTVGDYANAAISAGGNGAPDTGIAMVDYANYHDPTKNRVVQNIGGIGNCNLIPASGGIGGVVGFDTGPGVMVIDGLVRHYTDGKERFDADGEHAARGTVDEELLQEFMQDPFIQREPPKAAGRENYGMHFVRSVVERGEEKGLTPDDVIATGTALTAASIALGYDRWVRPHCPGPTGTIDEVIAGGGGALNPTLLRMLGERARCRVSRHEDYGVPGFAMESLYVAHVAKEAMLGHTNHAPWHSGGSTSTYFGLIAPGYRALPTALHGNGWRGFAKI